MTQTIIHVANRHDDGFDLASHEQKIGSLFWDHTVGDTQGWVLRFGEEHDEDNLLPGSIDEIIAALAQRGYELHDASLVEVQRLDSRAQGGQ